MNNENKITPAETQTSKLLNSGHTSILTALSMVSCIMFIYTGWAFLFAVPASFVFGIIYSMIFSQALKNTDTPVFAVYSITFTLVLSYLSILLNFGIVSDAEYTTYIIPSLLGIPSSYFNSINTSLLVITIIYFISSMPINFLLIGKKASKSSFAFVPLFALLLVIVHFSIVLVSLPELRVQVIKTEQENIQKEKERIDSSYSFNWDKVKDDTFKNRKYSIFTPLNPSTSAPSYDCPYATGLIEQNNSPENFSLFCLNEFLKPIGQFPLTRSAPIGINIPNSNNIFKKGDIVVLVAELDNPSMLRMHANGNAAKDCSCRMPPYDYSNIIEHLESETSPGIYEQSVVQMQVTDKKREIMVLYPININNLKDLEIKLSQFSDNLDLPITLKEVSIISTDKVYPDPEWLKKWSSQPNPFLNN